MILFLDTETNGMIKKYNRLASTDDNCPRIVQLAYSLYDHRSREVLSVSNLIIPEDPNIRWDPGAFAIHKKTKDMCKTEGVHLKDSLLILDRIAKQVDFVVCHSINFDKNVLESEYLRAFGQPSDNLFSGEMPWICSMFMSTSLCKLPNQHRGGYKWPSLSELHYFLFESEVHGAHDAGNDVKALADCFFKMAEIGFMEIPESIEPEMTYKDFISERYQNN